MMAYKVYSRFERPMTPFSPYGNGMDIVFEERFNAGVLSLEKVGEVPINPLVQESLEGTLIYNILERFNAGDPYALQKNIGQFVDATACPRSLAEAQQLLIDARNSFNSLPLDIRSKYGHNPMAFMEAVSQVPVDRLGEFFANMTGKKEVKSDAVKKTVPSDQTHGE